MPPLLTDLVDRVHAAGSDHLPTFGGSFEGGYGIQQVPEELARLTCLLAAYAPFRDSLEIGIAAGGTTRFLREHVDIARTTVIDDGRHPRFPTWSLNRHHVPVLSEFIGDSHSRGARDFLTGLGRAFDLVAIDGDHSPAGVRADWRLVQPFLAPGALVWFHDVTCVHCPGVIALWRELRDFYPVLLETDVLGIGVLRFDH